MKKSRLGDLFSEDSSSSDKSLLTYHRPQQPGVDGRSTDSPPLPANNSPSSTKHVTDRDSPASEKQQEGSPPLVGKGISPSNTPSTTNVGGVPELLHSCVVSAFTFSGSQSISLGSLGCALYWEPANHRSLLVLYRSRQQQVCLMSPTTTSLPAIQPQLYVSFQCDAGRQFSIHLASQAALKELAMKTVLAAALASAGSGGQSPVGLSLPVEDEASTSGGRRARSGDRLQLEVTEWVVQNPRSETLRQRGGTSSDTSALDSSWRSALHGAKPGQRWLVSGPESLDVVREVLVVAVRPPPRQAPLQLPADDGSGWRLGGEGASPSPETPPSPPSSPALPAVDADLPVIGATGNTEVESNARDVPNEGENMTPESVPSKGRSDVLARMARLGQQMFPSATGAGHARSPSPPRSPPPSPARRSSTPTNTRTSASTTAAAAAVTEGEAESVKPSAGAKPTVASRPPPGRLPSVPRPAIAPRPDSTELGVLFGRLEAKLETVLSRLEPPVGVDADAETLASGVRKLAAENAALREASRKADRASELRLEAERARAMIATELADSLAELTDTKRKLAETQRRLAAAEESANEASAAASRREAELKTLLAAARTAAAAAEAAKSSVDPAEAAAVAARAAKEPRRVLKGVYKTLRSRLPAEGTFTGAEVGEIVAEVVKETLQRVETETETLAGRAETQTETLAGQAETHSTGEGGRDGERGEVRDSGPPFVTQDECIEHGDE